LKKLFYSNGVLITILLCLIFFIIPVSFSQQNLSGIWIAEGYNCGDNNQLQEMIRITVSGKQVTATKKTGDNCVPAGEITWKGTYKKNSFPVKFRVSDGPNTALRWIDETVKIISKKTLKSYGVTYRKHPNKAQVETNRTAYAQDDGGDIIVKFSGLPGNKKDWISIMPASSDDDDYESNFYKYTVGKYFGELSFTNELDTGKYQARVYVDNGYTVEARYDFVVEKDQFRTWLWELEPAEINRLAKILEKDIAEWIKLGDQQLSHASLNMVTLRTARKHAKIAIEQSTKELKIKNLKFSLDNLDLMADVASLKMMLKFATAPPNLGKTKSIGLYFLNTSRKLAQYSHEKSKIKEAIEEQTFESFKRAGFYIDEVENKIFSR
jgi:hypothetical protein